MFVISVLMSEIAFGTDLQPAALNFAGIHSVRENDPELLGQGVSIGILSKSFTYRDGIPQNDYQPNFYHRCLEGKGLEYFYDPNIPASISEHSMGVCSIIFGYDENGYLPEIGEFTYEGVAPEADAKVFELWYFLEKFVLDSDAPDIEVLNASFGALEEAWWTRGLDLMAEQKGTIVVASAGNGEESYDPILYPGGNANSIAVGVIDSVNSEIISQRINNFGLTYPEHSSLGPTWDGRCKPDIVTAGNCLSGSHYGQTGYVELGSWSSFSSPVVAGTAALVLQKAASYPDMNDVLEGYGRNCAVKAILLNSARKLAFWHKGKLTEEDDGQVPLDHLQGAGALDARGAVENLIAGIHKPGYELEHTGWDLNEISSGENIRYHFYVGDPNEKYITATLNWNYHFYEQYPFDWDTEKNSDLRLEVWAVDSKEPEKNFMIDYSDSSVDNVEHVWFKADPNISEYEIVISDNYIGAGRKETYALAWRTSEYEPPSIERFDLNCDGKVDEIDSLRLAESVLNVRDDPAGYYIGDINSDGSIDVNDLTLMVEKRGITAGWYEGSLQNDR